MILLPAESLGRKQNYMDSLCRKAFFVDEARDRGQSQWKPNMTDSLCRKRKFADSIIPCGLGDPVFIQPSI